MKDAISLRKSLSVLGILIVTSGLMFTGLVKVREYVHGYEWAAFRFDPGQGPV